MPTVDPTATDTLGLKPSRDKGREVGAFLFLAITAGIFLPAFSFALLFYDRLERVIENERLHRLLEGISAGVVGLIAITALQLGWNVARSASSLALATAIFAAALALLYLWKSRLNVLAVVIGSALLGAWFGAGGS